MGNFKAGDKVVRTDDVGASTARITGIKLGGVYTVGGAYAGVITLVESFKPEFTFSETHFKLLEEQDDPLPPAPESVRYYHRGYHGIHADAFLDIYHGHFASGPRIRIKDKNNLGITIDADTALQLAHDLRRMAMEIKRKEKQNG